MTVVLDSYVVPEQGEFEVYVRRTVNLRVTVEAARRTVQRWLLHQVSYMMGAEAPHCRPTSPAARCRLDTKRSPCRRCERQGSRAAIRWSSSPTARSIAL